MYLSETVVSVIKRLNTTYFLPAIQRDFVWKPAQVTLLFDSIMQNYPIGALLLWELDADTSQRWSAYEFFTEAGRPGAYNQPASLSGITNPRLVLDGQQRLTSLLIGLHGSYSAHRKTNIPADEPTAWRPEYLYLNLLSGASRLESADNGATGVRFEFRFLGDNAYATAQRAPNGRYWFRVGRILDCATENDFFDLRRAEIESARSLLSELTEEQSRRAEQTLDLLYRRLWRDEIVTCRLEREQDANRVLDIFERANSGGTRLERADLLLSLVTANWGQLNARDELNTLVEHINRGLSRRNSIDKSFVLRCALVVCGLGIEYDITNFSDANMATIAAHWPAIKRAIVAGFSLVNSFGVDRSNLTATSAMIPVVEYLMRLPNTETDATPLLAARTANAIRCWLAFAIITTVFSGDNVGTLRKIRPIIERVNDHSPDFPLNQIIAALGAKADQKANLVVQQARRLRYRNNRTPFTLSLLYDEAYWAGQELTQDHIFPQSLFTTQNLTAAGFDSAQRRRYQRLANTLGNLQLITDEENKRKGSQPFETWIAEQDPELKRRHLIPDDANLYTLQRFPDFVTKRATLIEARLRSLFAGAR